MLTRRDFIKLAGGAAAGLAAANLKLPQAFGAPLPPSGGKLGGQQFGRTLIDYIRVYDAPDFGARQVAWYGFDEVLALYGEQEGPKLAGRLNSMWVETHAGWIHSMNIQPVQYRFNPIVREFPENGWLGEITVPYVDAHWYIDKPRFLSYRLYFGSVMWVQGLEIRPDDGTPMYRLYDERIGLTYYVPATHVRIIAPEEVQPIRPEGRDKRIVVDLGAQDLRCFEGETEVFHTYVSGGRYRSADAASEDGELTLSPEGRFRIIRKKPSRHMGGGFQSGTYELPGVPWVAYYATGGYAIHGAWWHNDWGFPQSAGCINMKPEEAKWVYLWSMPEVPYEMEHLDELGTEVEVVGYRW